MLPHTNTLRKFLRITGEYFIDMELIFLNLKSAFKKHFLQQHFSLRSHLKGSFIIILQNNIFYIIYNS